METVNKAWAKPVVSSDAIRVLHTRLSRTARALKKWDRMETKRARALYNVATELIFLLDLAQEERQLTDEENALRKMLKLKLLGFAAVERMRWRQRSRLTRIRVGNANTKLFHLRANGRRRKNHIPTLQGPSGMVHEHTEKAKIPLDHFKSLMGKAQHRSHTIN